MRNAACRCSWPVSCRTRLPSCSSTALRWRSAASAGRRPVRIRKGRTLFPLLDSASDSRRVRSARSTACTSSSILPRRAAFSRSLFARSESSPARRAGVRDKRRASRRARFQSRRKGAGRALDGGSGAAASSTAVCFGRRRAGSGNELRGLGGCRIVFQRFHRGGCRRGGGLLAGGRPARQLANLLEGPGRLRVQTLLGGPAQDFRPAAASAPRGPRVGRPG